MRKSCCKKAVIFYKRLREVGFKSPETFFRGPPTGEDAPRDLSAQAMQVPE
jgi:hypothetical protein